VVSADKGLAGDDLERFAADQRATFPRPDRRNQQPRSGSLGCIRQCIESVLWTRNGNPGPSATAPAPSPGLRARIGMRPLTPAAGLRHNRDIGQPGRHLTAPAHQFGSTI
jgi:hypothetical protein